MAKTSVDNNPSNDVEIVRVDHHHRPSLSRSVSLLLFANTVYTACQWLTLLTVVKLGSADEVGQFSMAFAYCAPVFMFANFELRSLLSTDVTFSISFRSYLQVRLFCAAAALIVCCVLAMGLPQSYGGLLFVVGLTKCFESLSDIVYGRWQLQRRFDWIGASLMLHGFATVGCFGLAFALTDDLRYAVAAMAVGRGVVTAIDFLANRRLEPTPSTAASADIPGNWRVLRLGLPLGATALIISLNSNVPRYVLAHYESEQLVGIFCAIAAVMTVGNMLFRAIEQCTTPRLAQHFAAGERVAFWKLLLQVIGVFITSGLAMAIVSIAFGKTLLTLFLSPDYAPYQSLLTCFAGALTVGLVAGAVYSAMIASRLIAWQIPMQSLTILVSIGASFVLIPRIGLWGAASVMLVSKIPYIVVGLSLLAWNQLPQSTVNSQTLGRNEVSYSA